MRRFKIVYLVLMLMLCTACGIIKAEPKQIVENKQSGKVEIPSGQSRAILLTLNGKKFTGRLEENSDTKMLIEQMPLDINMTNMDKGKFAYGGSFNEPQKGYTRTLKKGDIALCHSHYFLAFYDDLPANYANEYAPVGRITSGLENLSEFAKGGQMHIELKREADSVSLNDNELLKAQYEEMWQYMISKNIEQLGPMMTDEFTLTHMTGKVESKNQYLEDVQNGQLNYYTAKTEGVDVRISDTKAEVVGRSLVEAAVYGGGRNTWHLQLTFTLEKINGTWLQTGCKASTY